MNKKLIFLLLFLPLFTLGQGNFFWSHTGTVTTPVVEGCVEYGYLYNWYAVSDVRDISSSDDWTIPTNNRWNDLATYLSTNAGSKLKETGTTYWNTPNTGATNEVGFNGRGGGMRNNLGVFSQKNVFGTFWTTTPYVAGQSYHRTLGYNIDYIGYGGSQYMIGYSLRFVSDATGVSDGTTTTYTGNDGKVYNAVAINQLYWLSENLAETKYRNGDVIPTVENNTTWAGLTTGAKCAYNNDYTLVGCGEVAPPLSGWELLTTFQTNSPNTTTFDPAITSTANDTMFAWKIGDDIYYQKALSVTLDGTTKTVELYRKETDVITGITFNSDHIVGAIDLSNAVFSSVTSWQLQSNTGLTAVTFPNSISATVGGIYLNNTGITTLDVSAFETFSTAAAFRAYACSSLTNITFANSVTGTFTQFYIYNNPSLSGTLDLSFATAFTSSANILLYGNTTMTGVTFASSVTGTISNLHIYSTALTDTLDLSMFTSFTSSAVLQLANNPSMTGIIWASSVTGTFSSISLQTTGIVTMDLSKFTAYTSSAILYIHNNTSMTSLLLPSSAISGIIKTLYCYGTSLGYVDLTKFNSTATTNLLWDIRDNGWSAAVVNQTLVDIDAISTSGYTGRIINISGTNAAPDGSSGGYDGLTAKSNMETDGFAITAN